MKNEIIYLKRDNSNDSLCHSSRCQMILKRAHT